MDPLHITEFASPRYFDKLKQVNRNGGIAGTSGEAAIEESTTVEGPSFTLPLGNPRQHNSISTLRDSEQRKRALGHDPSLRTQRRPSLGGSLGSLRSRITLHRTISHDRHDAAILEEHAASQSYTLGELLLALPTELQAQIIAPLPIYTILDLRSVSRAFYNLVTHNESPITRYHIVHSLPRYTLRLYPLPAPCDLTLHYLCGIWHRIHVAAKLASAISIQSREGIFLKNTPAKRAEFEPQKRRMNQRLIPLIFAIFHFFESYRDVHLRHLEAGGAPLSRLPFTLNPFENQIMQQYDDRTLLHVHQVFPLVISSIFRRLRPPTYVGRVEGALKGYWKERPSDEIYATILTVGGLRQAQRFWETKRYNARRTSVDLWYGYLTWKPPAVEVASRSRISRITHLGRKKNSAELESQEPSALPSRNLVGRRKRDGVDPPTGHESASCKEWFCVKPTCVVSHSSIPTLVPSSLSLGPPMSPLSRNQLQLLLPDLPPLHDIWARSAEPLILSRKIVDRASAIKKNGQIFMDLIKDDGTDGLDDWTSGRPMVRAEEGDGSGEESDD